MKKTFILRIDEDEASRIIVALDYLYNEEYGDEDEDNKETIKLKKKVFIAKKKYRLSVN